MARRSGSLSRSLISTARISLRQTAPSPVPRVLPSSFAAPSRIQSRRLSFASIRNLGELGCTQSFLPLYTVTAATHLTSRLSVNVRACCELSHGTFYRTCPDR